MSRLQNILLLALFSLVFVAQAQDAGKADKKTIQKMIDWVSVFTMYTNVDITEKVDLKQYADAATLAQGVVTNNELSSKIAGFRQATFVNVYPKGLMLGDEWILKELNKVSDAQYNALNAPYLVAEVWFKPDAAGTSYSASIAFKTADEKINLLLPSVNQTMNSSLTGKTFSKPRDAKTQINTALFAGLDSLSKAVGSTFAPNVAIRYKDQLYLHNQTIEVWQKKGSTIELVAVDKDNAPLSSVTWTNIVSTIGSYAKYSVNDVGLNRVEVKSGNDKISVLVNVKEFKFDPTDLLKKVLVDVLTEKKKQAAADLATMRTDSATNANNIATLIAKLEKDNFPMEVGGATLTPMFSEPIKLTDTTDFAKSADRLSSFTELRKRKKLFKSILSKLDVVAFADLVVKKPDQLQTLLDDLIKNSGELIAQLIINQPGKEEDGALSIVTDYLNKNMERLVGTVSTFTQEPALPVTAAPASPPTFDASKFLYISPNVTFTGKDQFVKQLEDTLNKRKDLYVFINYSQDVSTSAYLQRAKSSRPKNITDGVNYKVYTLVNIPGSVEEQVISDCSASNATSSIEAILECVDNGSSVSLPCVGIFDDCDDVLTMLKAIKTKVAASSKYTMYYPSLPIFKPDPSKNRKTLYQGNYLGIENVDYSKIEIKNETSKDETIDPKVYYDYFEKEKDKFSTGFLFKLSDSSTFKILVSSEKDSATTTNKVESLRRYLFGNMKPKGGSTNKKILTNAQIKKLYPNVDEDVAKDLFSYIEEYRHKFGIDNCEKLIHFLTQADHESGGFVYMKEVGTFIGDREKYKGRGIFQLTFQSNYLAFQEFLKGLGIEVDLLNNPEKVEEGKYAVLSALWYWQKNNLSNYAVDLTTSSLLNISKLVNCGNLEYCGYKKDSNGNNILCTDCAPNGWEDRKERFSNHKSEIKCE